MAYKLHEWAEFEKCFIDAYSNPIHQILYLEIGKFNKLGNLTEIESFQN